MLRDEIEKKINKKRIQNKINNNQKNEEQIKKKKTGHISNFASQHDF
jgi:hypothetical protein